MDTFESIEKEIIEDEQNKSYTQRGIPPLYVAREHARICIIGQAPGAVAERTLLPWNDKSGDRLREWMGISRAIFYNSPLISIMPMDFYYPGKGKSGDAPPRVGFAEKWHPRLMKLMPKLTLIILVGAYAQKYYLDIPKGQTATMTLRNFRDYPSTFFPLVHPSPRNNIWLMRNPWFEEEVVRELRERVREVLGGY